MYYTIGEFSILTGFSIYTLRYYEKEKLIVPERKENGHRCYSEKDMEWVQFIRRLKETNMPIKEIQQYAVLRLAGDSTIQERLELLAQHRKILQNEFAVLKSHMQKLDDKINFYQKKLEK